jgi:hypothetical protein
MKKSSIILIVLIGLIIPTIQSCKKYEEGPSISLRSKEERVSNTWKVDNCKRNGTDYTSLVANYIETYTKDGNYSYSWGNASGTGKWQFQNSDKEIKLTGIDNQASHTLVILKLEEKVFWYYYMDGNDKMELHMVQN